MVYMLLGTGFEETEAIAPLDLLRRAGVQVQTVGLNGKIIYGGHGIGVEADIEIEEMDLTNLEMIILPGGEDPGGQWLRFLQIRFPVTCKP